MNKNDNNHLIFSEKHLTACEYVSPDHCDKVCDRVADSILDMLLEKHRESRLGLEVVGSNKTLWVIGEALVPSISSVELNLIAEEKAREVLGSLGETDISVISKIRIQDNVVHMASRAGSGDQSICIGYATDESPELLPEEFW